MATHRIEINVFGPAGVERSMKVPASEKLASSLVGGIDKGAVGDITKAIKDICTDPNKGDEPQKTPAGEQPGPMGGVIPQEPEARRRE